MKIHFIDQIAGIGGVPRAYPTHPRFSHGVNLHIGALGDDPISFDSPGGPFETLTPRNRRYRSRLQKPASTNGQQTNLRSTEFTKFQKTDFTHRRDRDLRTIPPGSHYSVHGDHGVRVISADHHRIDTKDEPPETTWAINSGVGLRMPDAEGRSVWDIQGHMQYLVDHRYSITPGHDYLAIHRPGIDFIIVPRLQNPNDENGAIAENKKAFAEILYSNALAMKATNRDDIMVIPTYWVPMTKSHKVLIEMDIAFHEFTKDRNRVIGPHGETIGQMYKNFPLRIPKASPLTETKNANIHAHEIIRKHNKARQKLGFQDFLKYDPVYRGNSDLSLALEKDGGAGGPIASLLVMRHGINLARAANSQKIIHNSLALGVGSRGGLVVPTASQIALNGFPDAGLNFQTGFMTGSPFSETLAAIDLIEDRDLSLGRAPVQPNKSDTKELCRIIKILAAEDTAIKNALLPVVIPMADAKLASDKRDRKSHNDYGRGTGGVAHLNGTKRETRAQHYFEPNTGLPGPRAIGYQNTLLDGLGISPAVSTLGALTKAEFQFVNAFLGGHLTAVLPFFAQHHDPDLSRFDRLSQLREVKVAVQRVNAGYEKLGEHVTITPNNRHIELSREHQRIWFKDSPPSESELHRLKRIKDQLGELRGYGG